MAKTKAFEQKHYLLEVRLRREEIDSFADYPFCLAAVRHLTTLTLHPAVTFIIGENGTGKSTLLEAIAIAYGFNPEGGSRNFNFATRSSHSSLHKFLRLSRGIRRARDGFFLRAESFYNVATEIERLDADASGAPRIVDSYGGSSLHEQSHGESFMSLVTHRFRGHGLYLLDEPEAALSPTRQMALITRIHDLVVDHSQFIIATHSPIIMAYPDAKIFHLSDRGIEEVAYTDTEHYRVSRSFLMKHEHMLRILMEK